MSHRDETEPASTASTIAAQHPRTGHISKPIFGPPFRVEENQATADQVTRFVRVLSSSSPTCLCGTFAPSVVKFYDNEIKAMTEICLKQDTPTKNDVEDEEKNDVDDVENNII